MLCISVLLAVVSACVILPDEKYANYVDCRTLGLLFCLMTVMAGLQRMGLFRFLAQKMLERVHSLQQLVPLLIFLCFFSGMVMTNDVALITFVPFTFTVLSMAQEKKWLVSVTAMQTIAANLGSMLTPIGNPQNLYLYGISGMSLPDFLWLMLPYTITAVVLLLLWSLFSTRKKKAALSVTFEKKERLQDIYKLWMYGALFVLCILTVARLVDYRIAFASTVVLAAVFDRKILRDVDYSLLLTFIGFFVFIGNMGRIPAFSGFIGSVIAGREAVTAVLASQCISNVPAALLLSGFTEDLPALIVGVNLGGLGTLIASMASLISFKHLAREMPEQKGRYLLYFTASNAVFLGILLVQYCWIG